MRGRARDRSDRPVLWLDTTIGVLLCLTAAALLGALFASSRISALLPFFCLAVVLAAAIRFGALTGVLGSALSALLLAYFIFSPQHSLHVSDASARANLSWLLLGGTALSFLLAPRSRSRR